MRILLLVGLLAIPVSSFGQQPAREALQRQIFERLIENYRVQAGLDDSQFRQFRSVFERQVRERRLAEVAQREMVQEIEMQLRPGIAADVDHLNTLLDQLAAHRVERARAEAGYLDEYRSFLSPIQRAQFLLTAERFQRQIDNLIRRRPGNVRP
jgi:hypothetical protein